jgi:hypothetical protein
MKKILIIVLLSLRYLSGCASSSSKGSTGNSDNIKGEEITYETINTNEEIQMKLNIDGQEIDCTWLDNDSVKELNLIKPLEIHMDIYGGFEQVGPIGRTIKSNDNQMTTEPGDIVLYNSNNIVVFFGSNNWSYTKLGHINLSEEQLKELLDKPNVTIRLE